MLSIVSGNNLLAGSLAENGPGHLPTSVIIISVGIRVKEKVVCNLNLNPIVVTSYIISCIIASMSKEILWEVHGQPEDEQERYRDFADLVRQAKEKGKDRNKSLGVTLLHH